DLLPSDLKVAGVLKQECTKSSLAEHEEPEEGPQLVAASLRVVAQKVVDQSKLPKRIRIVERSQFVPGYRTLDAGLKRWCFHHAPGKPGQRWKNQCHHAVRSVDPLRIALLRALTRRLPLLWKNRFTSWLSIAETLITTGSALFPAPPLAEMMFWRPWLILAGRIISFWCTMAS